MSRRKDFDRPDPVLDRLAWRGDPPRTIPSWRGGRFGRQAVLVGMMILAFCGNASRSVAQEDEFGKPPAVEGVEADGAAVEKPVVEPKGAADAAGAKNEPAPPKVSALRFFFEALGWSYTLAFFALSFVFVAVSVMCILASRKENICPGYLIEGFESRLNEKKYQEAYDLAKTDDSFLGRVLTAGLAKLNVGYPQAIESMQEVAEEESMKIDHRLSYIALIGTISPMVGLLGTVDGMVRAFSLIAMSNTTPKPSELAKGVSTALITTLVGLLIAIPAIGVFNILKNRFARMILEVGIASEHLMSRFQNVATKK